MLRIFESMRLDDEGVFVERCTIALNTDHIIRVDCTNDKNVTLIHLSDESGNYVRGDFNSVLKLIYGTTARYA